jgi:hypothetical protein
VERLPVAVATTVVAMAAVVATVEPPSQQHRWPTALTLAQAVTTTFRSKSA